MKVRGFAGEGLEDVKMALAAKSLFCRVKPCD